MNRQIVKLLVSVTGVLAITGTMATVTQAAMITGQTTPEVVAPGGTFDVTLEGSDFSTIPVSGDLKLTWETGELAFVERVPPLVPVEPWDSAGDRPENPINSIEIQVADNDNDVSAGFPIATYKFEFLGNAGDSATISLDKLEFGFLDSNVNEIPDVVYQDIVVSAVPIPAAVWLFGTALTGLGITGFRRRKLMVA